MKDIGNAPTAQFFARLGEQIRSRRKGADLTVQELADRAAISRRMLTHIELGQANPSLVTVDRIARALSTDFASLARDDGPQPLLVNSPDSALVVWSSNLGSRAVLHVATHASPTAELWSWTLEPHDSYRAEPDPAGSEELFLVISGRLTIAVDGDEPVTLTPGTSARLASDRLYSYENRTARPVKFVRVSQIV